MELHPIIKNNIEKLAELCKRFRVRRLYAFGSVVNGRFNESTSDIDFMVELEKMSPIEKGETLMNFLIELENLFQKDVDLLSDKPIKNPFFKKQVEETKQLIYDRRSEKVLV